MSPAVEVLAEILRQRSEALETAPDVADVRRAYQHPSWPRHRGWWRGEVGRLGLDHYETCARFILATGLEPEQADQVTRWWFLRELLDVEAA